MKSKLVIYWDNEVLFEEAIKEIGLSLPTRDVMGSHSKMRADFTDGRAHEPKATDGQYF